MLICANWLLTLYFAGYKVTWNGQDDLKVQVPSRFKNKVCGLCGNYNNDPNDDLLTKKGRAVDTLDHFIHSWKVSINMINRHVSNIKFQVGKRGLCPKEETSLSVAESRPIGSNHVSAGDSCGQKWEKKVEAISVCNILKATIFQSCHRKVSIVSYYKWVPF